MSLEDAPLEPDDDADQNWFAPIAMFIAWLAHLFEQIAKLKRIRRSTKFKSNWRDHWPDLRQCEWMRDQILASGTAQLLAGKMKEMTPAEFQGLLRPALECLKRELASQHSIGDLQRSLVVACVALLVAGAFYAVIPAVDARLHAAAARSFARPSRSHGVVLVAVDEATRRSWGEPPATRRC